MINVEFFNSSLSLNQRKEREKNSLKSQDERQSDLDLNPLRPLEKVGNKLLLHEIDR